MSVPQMLLTLETSIMEKSIIIGGLSLFVAGLFTYTWAKKVIFSSDSLIFPSSQKEPLLNFIRSTVEEKSHSAIELLYASLPKHNNRPFASSHSRGAKPPSWRAKVALGEDKQKTYIILNGNFLCLSCPSVTFALQYGGFVPHEGLAAKGLL